MKENKKCFGSHIFEDIKCMSCPDDSKCMYETKHKERLKYLDIKFKKDPQCISCIRLSCGNRCNSSPKYCIGHYYNKGNVCDNCKCSDRCLEISLNNIDKFITIYCKKTLECIAYSNGIVPILYAKKYYTCKVLNGNLYFNQILLFKDYENSKIFNMYFKIV